MENTSPKLNSQYIPGVCNIGPAEINARKRFGVIGLIVTVALWIGFAYFHLSSPWFLLLFFPAIISATGFIQGFSHFCAGFGMKGLFNFGLTVGNTDTVSQAEFRAKDKKKATQIFVYSIITGLAVAVISYFIH